MSKYKWKNKQARKKQVYNRANRTVNLQCGLTPLEIHRHIQDDLDNIIDYGSDLLNITDQPITSRHTDTTLETINSWCFNDGNTLIERYMSAPIRSNESQIIDGWRTSGPNGSIIYDANMSEIRRIHES